MSPTFQPEVLWPAAGHLAACGRPVTLRSAPVCCSRTLWQVGRLEQCDGVEFDRRIVRNHPAGELGMLHGKVDRQFAPVRMADDYNTTVGMVVSSVG